MLLPVCRNSQTPATAPHWVERRGEKESDLCPTSPSASDSPLSWRRSASPACWRSPTASPFKSETIAGPASLVRSSPAPLRRTIPSRRRAGLKRGSPARLPRYFFARSGLGAFAAAPELGSRNGIGQGPARPRRKGQRRSAFKRQTRREALCARPGNHGAVVGAVFRRRNNQPQAGALGRALELCPDHAVGGDAASSDQRRDRHASRLQRFNRLLRLLRKVTRERALKRGRKVGDIVLRRRREAFGGQSQRRLQP